MDATPDFTVDDEAARHLPDLGRVLVPTDDSDERLATTRRVATRLAADHGWQLVLYDRSQERWTDTPHPSGPVTKDELDGDRWDHLVGQMADIEQAGVTVTAWLATVPSLTAMVDTLQAVDIDAILLPDELGEPTLMDRLLQGDDPTETVERVAELQVPGKEPPRFLVLGEDGTVSIFRA